MKTVLISGASHGIGKELALTFANNGYSVAINYNRSQKEATELYNQIVTNGGNAILVQGDVSDPICSKNIVNTTLKCFGHIDVLINNAGISSTGLLIDEEDSTTKDVVNTNLLGTIFLTKNVAKSMIERRCGKIINISSMWGICGASCECTYSATKAALICLTKSFAKEVGNAGISVNCIAPGLIATKMNSHLSKEEMSELIESIPLGRIGTPKDVASVALFLASEQASYITGQTITVDGGFVL